MPQHNEGFCTKVLLESCIASDLWCIDKGICVKRCGRNPFKCIDFCERLLEFVVDTVKMTRLIKGSTHLEHPDDPEKSGVSAFAIIAESHVALHTWSETNALRLVIDSCKDYDVEDLVNSLCFVTHPAIVRVWIESKQDREWVFLKRANKK